MHFFTCYQGKYTFSIEFWALQMELLRTPTMIKVWIHCQTASFMSISVWHLWPTRSFLRWQKTLVTWCQNPTHQVSQPHCNNLDVSASKHSLYSPDFASSDFHLSGPLKKHLCGHMIKDAVEVQEAVSHWFPIHKAQNFCTEGINSPMTQCYKCVNFRGKYMEN